MATVSGSKEGTEQTAPRQGRVVVRSGLELREDVLVVDRNSKRLRQELEGIFDAFEKADIRIKQKELEWSPKTSSLGVDIAKAAERLFRPNWIEPLSRGSFSTVAEEYEDVVILAKKSVILPAIVGLNLVSLVVVTDHQAVTIDPEKKTFNFDLGGDGTVASLSQATLIARALIGIGYKENTH